MSKKSKNLFVASIITYFLPLVLTAVYWIFLILNYQNTVTIFMMGVPTIAGIVLYLIVPLYKKHYYGVTDNRKERKLAIITTCIQCGAPALIDLIMIWVYFEYPAFLFLRIIFIVLLAAGHIGGIVGMLAAIPAYTVLRVIASRFFYHLKPIRRLIPDRDGEA